MDTLIDLKYLAEAFPDIVRYAPVTLLISLISMGFGLIIGLFTVLMRLYKVPIMRWIASVYVSFVRGTPLLVQMYLAYYGIPKVLNFMGQNYGWNLDVSSIPGIVFVYFSFLPNEKLKASGRSWEKAQRCSAPGVQ